MGSCDFNDQGDLAKTVGDDNMVKIFADSTCDLSEELVKRYDITVVPLHIVLDDKVVSH